MSKFTVSLVLIAVWVLLWGSASAANLLSGVAVAVALFVIYPSQLPRWPVRRLRPWAVLVLLARFAVDVVVSTFWLVIAALAPSSWVRSTTVWVDLQFDDPALITMVTNLTALTPGSMVVRAAHHDDGRPTVQVHCLATGDPERFARTIAGLEVRCVKALGTAGQVAALRPVPADCGICDGPEDPTEREAL
jgi:multicomponent Na+:H+ antiporter subunit E